MASRAAKYCTDQDRVRWTLIEGIITRKTREDSPTDGQELAVSKVTTVEHDTVKRAHRSFLAWPLTASGIALLGIAFAVASLKGLLPVIPIILIALLCLSAGMKRIRPQVESVTAWRIVAPGAPGPPNLWTVVGSMPEVIGFIDGVRAEIDAREKPANGNQGLRVIQ